MSNLSPNPCHPTPKVEKDGNSPDLMISFLATLVVVAVAGVIRRRHFLDHWQPNAAFERPSRYAVITSET
jgi:hypothetical protein